MTSSPPPSPASPQRRPHRSSPLLENPKLRAKIVAAARKGTPLAVAWRSAHLSHTTWDEWFHAATTGRWLHGGDASPDSLVIIREFCEQVAVAQAQHEEDMINSISDSATGQNDRRPDWKAAAFFLTHSGSRERWFPHHENAFIDHTVRITQETKIVKALPEGDLVTLIDPGWAPLLETPSSSEK